MIKKKSSILLLLLLAVFFIGLFSTSYATEFTEIEIKNIIYNSLTNFGEHDSQFVKSAIDDFDWSTWSQYTSDYDYVYIISPILTTTINSSANNDIFIFLTNNNTKKSTATYIYCNAYYSVRFKNGVFTNSLGGVVNTYISQNGFNVDSYRFNDLNLYNSSNGSTITLSNGWHPSNIDSGPYVDNKFEFSPLTTNFELCSINGLVEPSEVYVYDRNNQDYLTLGYLEKFSNLDNITITRYRYTKANGWIETSVNAFNDFTNYNVQDDILTYTIDVSKISADTLVIFNFTPKDIETFTNQVFALYVKSPFTFISSGVIYPSQTFSGDYYNNYNDDSNTDKIVDNNKSDSDKITDTLTDDSQVDNIIGSYLSGDIETYAHDFGFTPLDNPFTTFLLYVLEGTYDTLTRSGNVTLSANYKNALNFELKSQDFVSPESPLKTFIRMMLITWYLYGNYKFFHHLITLVETAKIDRAVAELGTDEFYDTDIM